MRFTHIFSPNIFYTDCPNRQIVVTLATDINQNSITVGYSIKTEGDQYIKKVGNEHAIQRAKTSFPLPACFTNNAEIQLWSTLIARYLIERDFGMNRTPLLRDVSQVMKSHTYTCIKKAIPGIEQRTAVVIEADITAEIAYLLDNPNGNKFEDEFSKYWFKTVQKFATPNLSVLNNPDFSHIETLN